MSSQSTPKSTKPDVKATGFLRALAFLLLVVALTSGVVLLALSTLPQFQPQTAAPIEQPNTENNTQTTTANALSIAYSEVSYRESVMVNPGMDIDGLIDQYPPGTVFVFRSGEYRGVSIEPRDGDVFVAEPNTILNGAKVLEASAFRQEGNVWVIDGQTQEEWSQGVCEDDAPRCNYAYVVYFNHQPLPEANSIAEVGAGTWFFDYANDRVYLGDNPNGHLVEISDTWPAFRSEAANVVIRNFIIEKYASPAQSPAVGGSGTRNWIVQNNIIRLNGGHGVTAGTGMQVLGNQIVHNGQLGLLGRGDDIRVEDNEIAYNNFKRYQSKWEAGGAKFVITNRLVVRNNYVHNNGGPGLWTDIDNYSTLYEGNLVVANETMGIFHEISYDAIIRNNIVKFNAPSYREWLYGAQILISNSSDVEVYNNEVVAALGGGHGVVIIEQDRVNEEDVPYFSRNNRVHDNTVVHMDNEGVSGAGTDVAQRADFFYKQSNNVFDNNTYYVANPASTYWYWGGLIDWEGFRANGLEPNGVLVGEVPIEAASVPRWPLME